MGSNTYGATLYTLSAEIAVDATIIGICLAHLVYMHNAQTGLRLDFSLSLLIQLWRTEEH